MTKGFRRTAFSLITISLVTALVASLYLYFNFNSRSNLPLIVPGNVHWFYHFQTREIKKQAQGQPPAYFDTLIRTVKKLPVLASIRDAGEPGLALYSDMVLFRNDDGWFAGLTVSSENRLKQFCGSLQEQGFTGALIERPDCYYLRSRTRHLYFAFKHKACVFYVPADTAQSPEKSEAALSAIFREQKNPLINQKALQELYDADCHVVFWNNQQGGPLTHGVNLSKPMASFTWKGQKPGSSAPSPLSLFSAAGQKYEEQDVSRLMDRQNRMGSNEYLNQSFRIITQYLKPFIQ